MARMTNEAGDRRSELPALELVDVHQTYAIAGGLSGRRRPIPAVRGVSLQVRRGETLGLVGESGCGKSTLARIAVGLEAPESGQVLVGGRPAGELQRLERARLIQPVFQDPYSSLNPRHDVGRIVGMPLRVHGGRHFAEQAREVRRILDLVGLPQEFVERRPHEISGGQRQRVAIARALVLRPEIVVCDEPTSSLDVSIQAQILNLLLDLQKELSLTYLIISHNLSVIAHMSDHVAVMYLGRIVEEAATETLFEANRHPYTRALTGSVLAPEPGAGIPAVALGEGQPDASALPPGCTFHPRCPEAMPVCRIKAPLPTWDGRHRVECHLAGEAAG